MSGAADGLALLVVGLGLAGAGGSAAAEERLFILEIGGEDVAFTGECRFTAGGLDHALALDGTSPFRRELTASRLRCQITQTSDSGVLTVDLRRISGGVSRARTQGRGSTVTLSMG
jgi:hypothetical protein